MAFAEESPELGVASLSLSDLFEIQVTSAGFFNMSAKKAPGTVLVIPNLDLENYPMNNLAEILDKVVPGAVVGMHARNTAVLGTRGIAIDNNSKTLVMVDGQGINMRAHFGYMYGMMAPFLGDMKQLEIIQGPGAIQHGSGAINGFINLVPKNGEEHPGLRFGYTHGIKDQMNREEISYGKSFGEKKNIFLYGGLVLADGFKVGNEYGYDVATNDVKDHGNYTNIEGKLKQKVYAFPKPTYKLASYINYDDFNLNAFLQKVRVSSNTFDNNASADGYIDYTLMGLRPKFVWKLDENHSIDIVNAVELTDYSLVGDKSQKTTLTVLTKQGDTGTTSFTDPKRVGGSENHYEAKAVYKTTAIERNLLAAGGLWGTRRFNLDKNYFSSPDQTDDGMESINSSWQEIGFFAEDIWQIIDPLTLSLGLRWDNVIYDRIETTTNTFAGVENVTVETPESQSHFSPRIALAYELFEKQSIKASYQEGFHYPDAAYFIWWQYNATSISVMKDSLGSNYRPLPSLKPEIMRSLEATYSGSFIDMLTVDVTGYFNQYEDLMMWHWWDEKNPNEIVPPAEVALIKRKNGWMGSFINYPGTFSSGGGEISLRAIPYDDADFRTDVKLSFATSRPINMTKKANAFFHVAYQEGDSIGGWQTYPQNMVKGNVTQYVLNKKLMLNLNLIYNSATKTDMSNASAKASAKDFSNEDRIVLDAAIAYNFSNNVSLKLYGQNLTSNKVVPASLYSNEPWAGSLGMTHTRMYLTMTAGF